MSLQELNRRAFLRRTGALSIMGAAAPWAATLATMAEASAATDTDDYKALVCVFLSGGNDHGNTLIPYHPQGQGAYETYARARSNLALPFSSLSATRLSPLTDKPLPYDVALAPSLSPIKPLFDAGRLAVLANIGPLLRPTTLADYNKGIQLPPQLFSHNDQQAVWQSYAPEGGTVGWGGRIGDLYQASNGQRASFTCVNLAGNAVYLSGQSVVPYALAPDGPAALTAATSLYGSSKASQVFKALVTQQDHPVLMARAHTAVMTRALAAQQVLQEALAAAPPVNTPFNVQWGPLARQLKMVAQCIAARHALGLKRQVFFVSLGGFDLHDRLFPEHARLLQATADALAYFDAAMRELGVSRQVTTFTASDFGRTLTSNGDGSDHGWGGHQFVMGGAVSGRRVFGTLPPPDAEGSHQVGQGRLLPTLAVDQLAAELGRWMGVSETNLPLVAPRHQQFSAAALKDLFTAGA